MDSANSNEALLEVALDIAEGADMAPIRSWWISLLRSLPPARERPSQ